MNLITITGTGSLFIFYWINYMRMATEIYVSKFAGFSPYSINQISYCNIMNHSLDFQGLEPDFYFLKKGSSIYKEEEADLYIVNNVERHPFEQPFSSIKQQLKNFRVPLETM